MNLYDLVPIIGIIFGTTLTGYIFAKIVGLIKYWIDHRGGHDSEDIDLLLHQFNDYKNNVEKRLRHLEAIVTDETDTELHSPMLDDEMNDLNEMNDQDAERRRLQNMLKNTHI